MKDRTPVTDADQAITIQGADSAQIGRIARVWHEGWVDGHAGRVPDELLPHRTLATFERRVGNRLGEFAIAIIRNEGRRDDVAGFVIVRGDEVEQIYVAAEHRSRGVADALLAHAESVIAGSHSTGWLAVVAGNTRARRFYERHGWTDRGEYDCLAEITDGTMSVPSHRYEKHLTRKE